MNKTELLKKLIDCPYQGDVFMASASGPIKVAKIGGVVGMAGRGYNQIILYDEETYKELIEDPKK
jgi:hypothetical protein